MFALGWLVTYFMINSTLVGSNSSCFISYNNLSYFVCLLCELPEIRVSYVFSNLLCEPPKKGLLFVCPFVFLFKYLTLKNKGIIFIST